MTQIGVRAFRLRNGRHHHVWPRIAAFVGLKVARHSVRLTDGVALAKTPVSLDPGVSPRYLAGGGVGVAFEVSPVEPRQAMGKRDAAPDAGRKR
jgi:hypothetical protein